MKPVSMSEASSAAAAAAAAALGLVDNSFDGKNNDISIEGTARRYIIRSLMLDSMGLISHAASTARIGVEACSSISGETHNQGEVSENLSAVQELSIQLHHFTRALYAGLLHPDAEFIRDWLGCSLSKIISDILEAWVTISTSESEDGPRCTPASIIEIIVSHIRPMSEGPFCMYQSCSRENLFRILSVSLQSESNTTDVSSYCRGSVLDSINKALLHCKDQEKDELYMRLLKCSTIKIAGVDNSDDSAVGTMVEDAIERVIVTSLGGIVDCSKNRLDGLETILELASASLPTLPRGQRCLRSPMRLASLVVTACGSFDNTYASSAITSNGTDAPPEYLPLMWQLIETTPTSLVAFDLDGLPKESSAISAQLDVIQAALAVSEVVQCYMATPPLFLLLGDQSERGDSCRIVRSDSSHIRRARRMYIRDLLTGCGFLIAGLDAISADTDVTHEEEKETLSASSVEILSNMVSMGQALILRMCYEYGRAQRVAASSGRSLSSGDEGNSRWAATAQDVKHLCSSFKSRAVPPVWAGHALLQCMLFFKGVDSDFKNALKTITNLEARLDGQNGLSSGSQDQHVDAELGTTLFSLGVESAHMERLVLKRAVEIFNSVSSCESAELREVESLLALLPQHAKCPVLASAVRYERALMAIVGLLSTLQVDLLPLQLRMLSPPDIAKKLLAQKPQAYYELDGPGELESLYCIDADGEEDGDRTDLLLKRNSLREKQPPGSLLISLLSTLHNDSPKTPPVSATSPSTLLHTVVAVQLELLFAAINMSDLEGAYCLCRVLLMAAANTDQCGASSLPAEALKRISESALLVMGMLDCPDPSSEELHHALRSDLLSIMLTRTPVAELDRFSSLWRHLPLHTSSDTADHTDEVNISAATLALLDTVVRMLKRSDVPGQSSSSSSSSVIASEVVGNSGSDTGRLSDAIGHLLLVKDSAKVHGLIEKLYADLDRKLSSTLMREKKHGNSQISGYGRSSMTLDESLVSMVVSKGFSRNSSKRAVLATRGEGFREALSWAVEHSRDEDFEFPIAETVKGALLSNNEDSQCSLDPEKMKAALKVLADVSEMYQRHSASASGSGIGKSSAISSNGSASASPSRGASILLQDIYPAEEPEEWHTAEEQFIERAQVEGPVEIAPSAEAQEDVEEMIFTDSPIYASFSPRSLPFAPSLPPMYTGVGKFKPIPRAAVFDFKGGDGKEMSPMSAVSTPLDSTGVLPLSSAAVSATSQSSSQEEGSPSVIEIIETVGTLVTPPTDDIVDVKVQQKEEEYALDSGAGAQIDAGNVVIELESVDMRSAMPSSDEVLLSPVSLFTSQNLPAVTHDLDTPSAPIRIDEALFDEKPVHVDTVPNIDSIPPPLPLLPASTHLHVALDESPVSGLPTDQSDLNSREDSAPIAAPAASEIEEALSAPIPLPLSAPLPAPLSLSAPLPPLLPTPLPTLFPLPVLPASPLPALLPVPPPVKEAATAAASSAVTSVRTSVISATNSNVMKAHLVSRLRGVLDVAEDFTGIGVNAADLSRSVINGEGTADGEGEIGGAYDQIFHMCRSLATHRRIASFQFLPQLLSELPERFRSDVALKAEQLIFGDAPSSSHPSGVALEDSLWALAALRLLVYHKVADAAAYSVCCTTLYAESNGPRTVALLAHLYKGLEGSNLDALIGIKRLAADHLSPLTAVDNSTSASSASPTATRASTPVSVKCIQLIASAILRTSNASPLHPSSTPPSIEKSFFTSSPSSSSSIVAGAFKQLQDDIAVLNRVRRIPDATGVNAKSLLKLQLDDLYWVQGDSAGGSHQNDMDTKRRYRRQTLLAVGPYLYPQTITNWVRVIGKQLGLGSTDFNFQYACCTLSTTVIKALDKTPQGQVLGGERGLGLDSDSWSLLANELSSSVKRMKPEHTIALCYIVGGIALPEAAWYSGCEMLFPMGEIPDQAVDALLAAILTAVQTVATPTSPTGAITRSATSAVPLAVPTTLFSLTAQQAGQLLPSVSSVRDLLSVVHSCLQPFSPFRDAVLLMCLDKTGALEDLLASILCSAMGSNQAVLQLVTACALLRTGEASRAQSGSPAPACHLTTAFSIEAITVKSIALISDLLSAVGSEEKDKPLGASGIALSATQYLLLHSHSNFGPLVTHRIFEELCAAICQSPSHPLTPSEGEVVSQGTVSDSFLDCCISVLSACNTIISNLTNSSQGQGDEQGQDRTLSELLQSTGEPAFELLMTRRIVSEVQLLSESDYWSEEEAPEPISIKVILSSVHVDDKTNQEIYVLSNIADRERLFAKLSDLVSEVSGPAAETAARALVRLLRCWGVSKNNGSLQRALEGSFLPLSSPASTGAPSSSSSSFTPFHPTWLTARMHLSLWGRTLQLLEKGDMYVDIVEVLLVDLNFNFNADLNSMSERCICVASDVEIEKHTSAIRQLVASLTKSPTVPSAFKHAFGLACGGSLGLQAVRDLQGDIAAHPSDSFSVSLFMLLLSLEDRVIVSVVARSPELLLKLVQITSECQESRLSYHFQASSNDFASDQPRPHGPLTLLQLLHSIPDSAGQDRQERGGGGSVLSSRCDVLPLVLSPCNLVALLLNGGFFCQAAHIHWTAVTRRPQGMYTADAAASLLFDHFATSALPFYLVASSSPREMLSGVWGWGRWKTICEVALSK